MKIRKPLKGNQIVSPVDKEYESEASMIADQSNQFANFIYFDGDKYWEYLGTTNGDITDYRDIISGVVQVGAGAGLSIDENGDIQLGDGDNLVFNDVIGLSYVQNFFNTGSLNDRWIPDWGAVKSFVNNSVPQTDGVSVRGTITQLGNELTLNNAWRWRINNIIYAPTGNTTLNFPATSAGFHRIDLIVGNNSGVISRVAGTAVAVGDPVFAPSAPANTVPLAEVTVLETGIASFIEFALASFVRFDINNQGLTPSQRSNARANIGSTSMPPQIVATAGAIDNLAITSNNIVFTGANVVLSGIVAGLDGEEVTILNTNATALSILSQSGLSNVSNRIIGSLMVPQNSVVRLKYRATTNRWIIEALSAFDSRYVRKDVNDTKINDLTIQRNSDASNVILFRPNASLFGTMVEFGQGNGLRYNRFAPDGYHYQRVGDTGSGTIFNEILRFNGDPIFRFQNGAITPNVPGAYYFQKVRLGDGAQQDTRSSNSNGTIRRDELYLNYLQTIVTAGTINDLGINADCKLLILTGADDLTGVVGEQGRLLRIEARGAQRIIRHESGSSTAANRFSNPQGVDIVIPSGAVYTFFYTNSRWRLISTDVTREWVGTQLTEYLGNITTSVPANSTSIGVKGTIAYDSNFLYLCVATNQWIRASIDLLF